MNLYIQSVKTSNTKEHQIYLYIFFCSAKSSTFSSPVFNCFVTLQWTPIKNCPPCFFNIEVRPISLFRLPRLWRSLLYTENNRTNKCQFSIWCSYWAYRLVNPLIYSGHVLFLQQCMKCQRTAVFILASDACNREFTSLGTTRSVENHRIVSPILVTLTLT